MFSQDGLGVKLHTFHVQMFVANAHDFAIRSPGSYFQTIRQRFTLDRQRVITNDIEPLGQALVDAAPVGADRQLPVEPHRRNGRSGIL